MLHGYGDGRRRCPRRLGNRVPYCEPMTCPIAADLLVGSQLDILNGGVQALGA